MDKYRFELWDGESPINGVTAERLMQIHPIKGVAYIIFRGDQPVIFQWHNPSMEGNVPMDKEEADAFARQSINELSTLSGNDG